MKNPPPFIYDNPVWSQIIDSDIGKITLVTPPKPANPVSKRYHYQAPRAEVTDLYNKLKELKKKYKGRIQCDLIEWKTLAKGCRLSGFLLSYAPGFVVNGSVPGIGKTDWEALVESVNSLLTSLFPDLILYAQKWSTTHKFGLRFEMYIQLI